MSEQERVVRALYYAARWSADRPVDEAKLWTDVRDAFGFPPGESPTGRLVRTDPALQNFPMPEPPEPAKCVNGCDLPDGGDPAYPGMCATCAWKTWLKANTPPPPEPPPDERWLPNEAVRELVTDLQAQLAAAQAEVSKLERRENLLESQLQAATERAEKAERDRWRDALEEVRQVLIHEFPVGEHFKAQSLSPDEGTAYVLSMCGRDLTAERDAAIKAKEEAERALKAYVEDTAVTCAFCEARHDRPVTFEDIKAHIFVCPKHPLAAERKRADEEQAQRVRLTSDLLNETRHRQTAQATAEALRAALERLRGIIEYIRPHGYVDALAQINAALAAHSKAVGP